MALFFEYACSLNERVNKGGLVTGSFSNGEHPILACSTRNGEITFFLEEGEPIEPDVDLRRPSIASVLSWHPKQNLLASGWEDGCIALWSEKERILRDDSAVHKSPITVMQWSPIGSWLVTGDQSGVVAVWSIDNRARLQLLCQYSKKSAVTHVVFRNAAKSALSLSPCTPVLTQSTHLSLSSQRFGCIDLSFVFLLHF